MRKSPRPFIPILLLVMTAAGSVTAQDAPEDLKAVQADRVYLEDGSFLDQGWVLIKNGRIAKVGTGAGIAEGAEVIRGPEGCTLTPGLIDAASTAGVINPSSWTEHASEVVPHLRNLDALDLDSKDFERLAALGVTTVYVTPGAGSVIGCRGTVVKTGGPLPERILKDRADVKANMGPEGWRRGSYNREPRRGSVSFLTRRPTTRMGMTMVFRQAFYDALAYERAKKTSGKIEEDPALEVLLKVLKGEFPLRIQAREDIDIWSAIRLCKEFGLKFVLEEGTEAYRCIPEIKAYGVPVIYGPIFVDPLGWRARSGEQLRPCLNGAGLLAEAGIPLALTAGDLAGEDALPRQAGHAIRNGLAFEEAFKAVTVTPARLLGVEGRVGAVKPGLDGDLVLWSGKPFAPASKPVAVLIGGRVIYQDDTWTAKR